MEYLIIILSLGLILLDLIMVASDIDRGEVWDFWIMLFFINSVLFSMLVLGNSFQFVFKWIFLALALITFISITGAVFVSKQNCFIGGADIFFILSIAAILGIYSVYVIFLAFLSVSLIKIAGYFEGISIRFLPILSVWAYFVAILLLI